MGDDEGAEESGDQVMGAATELRLPDILREHQAEIADALTRPSLRTWSKGDTYQPALQAAAIGAVLVDAIHTHLVGAEIGYLFKEKIAKRDRTVLAQASKVSGKTAYYSHLDLLVEVNWQQWTFAGPADKIALIDHELSHFGREEDDKGRTQYVLLSHDLEEFGAIVRRWGLWKPDVRAFAHAIRDVQQSDLFGNAEPDDEASDD